MRDDMFSSLVTIILGQVQISERLVLTPHSTSSLDPYLSTLRVLARKNRYTPQQYLLARKESNFTTRQYPEYASGWIAKGFIDYLDAVNSLTGEYGFGDLDEIERAVRRGLNSDATIPMGWHILSLIKGSMNEPVEALKAAEKAYGLAPRDSETLLFLSKAMLTNGRIDEAHDYLSKAMFGYPILPSYVQLYRARTFWAAGRLQESVDAAEDCVTKAPGFTNCWIQKAVSLFEIGDRAAMLVAGEQFKLVAPATNKAMYVADFQSQEGLGDRLIKAAEAIGVD